jgi:hypothetical protein
MEFHFGAPSTEEHSEFFKQKIKADQGVLDFAEEVRFQQDLYNAGAPA